MCFILQQFPIYLPSFFDSNIEKVSKFTIIKKLPFKGIEKNCCEKFKVCPTKRQTHKEWNLIYPMNNTIKHFVRPLLLFRILTLKLQVQLNAAEGNKQRPECSIKKVFLKIS